MEQNIQSSQEESKVNLVLAIKGLVKALYGRIEKSYKENSLFQRASGRRKKTRQCGIHLNELTHSPLISIG